jgi:Flp pilus assembly protein TadB
VVVDDVAVLGTVVVVDVVVELGTVVDVVVVVVVVLVVVVVVVTTRAQLDSARATKWEEQMAAEALPAMEHRAAIR